MDSRLNRPCADSVKISLQKSIPEKQYVIFMFYFSESTSLVADKCINSPYNHITLIVYLYILIPFALHVFPSVNNILRTNLVCIDEENI